MINGNGSNGGNGDFNFQQLLNITGQTAMNVNQMSQQMGIMASQVSKINDKVDNLDGRMYQLENNEEITTAQKNEIIRKVSKRAFEIIGDDLYEQEKYKQIFIKRLYADAKKYTGLGARTECTKKGDYQRVIDYIEAWTPSCGCANLKRRADEKAMARMYARNSGYLD